MTPVLWLTAVLDRPGPDGDLASAFWTAATARVPGAGPATDPGAPPPAPCLAVRTGADGSGGWQPWLHTADVAGLALRTVDLGARPAGFGTDPASAGHVTLVSPGGVGFRVVPAAGAPRRVPGAAPAPGTPETAPDRLTVSVPAASFAAETAFWGALAGGAALPGPDPDVAVLPRPEHLPLRIVVRRDGGPAACRPDLACNDLDAAVTRHLRLGARVRRPEDGAIELVDPSGTPYRLVRRPATA